MKYINQYGCLKTKECDYCQRAGNFINIPEKSSTFFCDYYKYAPSVFNCPLFQKRKWYQPKHKIIKLW